MILFYVFFKNNYFFESRLEIKNVVLREIFGVKIEKLTGGWIKFQWALGE